MQDKALTDEQVKKWTRNREAPGVNFEFGFRILTRNKHTEKLSQSDFINATGLAMTSQEGRCRKRRRRSGRRAARRIWLVCEQLHQPMPQTNESLS